LLGRPSRRTLIDQQFAQAGPAARETGAWVENRTETAAAGDALRRGDLLAACDLAASGLRREPDCAALAYIRILALARMGHWRAALADYQASGLARSPDLSHRALLGRLLKDRAATLPADERGAGFAAAGEAYRALYLESGDPYPGINAATLAVVAGAPAAGREIAQQVLSHLAKRRDGDYFAAATRAEALLVTGDGAGAAAALRRAAALREPHDGARTSTIRQFRLLLESLPDAGPALEPALAMLRPPPVLTYCGHMFRADSAAEAGLRARIAQALDRLEPSIAYGSLACGGDIMVAEAVLARGGELNIVLPFDDATFIERSVRGGGEAWLERFARCRDGARSVTYATDTEFVGDRGQYRFGQLLAMGLARLRAAPTGADAVQLAVWDGRGLEADAGTGAEVRQWRASGGETVAVDPGPIDRQCGQRQPAGDRPRRALCAILFADFAGFSRLREADLPAFASEVLGRVSAVLRNHGDAIRARNTWGDGVFAILTRCAAAAAAASELQSALEAMDHEALQADGGGMRISLHFGPVYEAEDPVTGSPTFFGREVTRAARIEPVTPVGGVYLTQPFAAMLAMEAPGRFPCTYLGRVELAKGFATMPMYSLG
jgi:class 3 adenylate cyclase